MARVNHRYRLRTSDGESLRDIEGLVRVEFQRIENDVGWFDLTLPGDYPEDLLDVDRIIEFWREPEGGENQLFMTGFLRKWEWFEDQAGTELLRISGPDQIELLDRCPIAYVAGSPESTKTEATDDMLKAIVREGKGALAGLNPEGRFRGYPLTNFTVMDNQTLGPVITRSFHWRDMLPVLQEIAETSRDRGTPLFFDCIPGNDPATFEFQTFTEQLGEDHTLTTGSPPVVFSKAAGNLVQPSLQEDWTEEWNYVWGGGQGEGAARLIDTENDLLRILRSIWNRREVFQDAREEDTALGVASKAFERMEASRPRLNFRGTLLDTPANRFGIDWGFGDRVTAQYKGQNFDGTVRFVRLRVDHNGVETLQAKLEVVRATG